MALTTRVTARYSTQRLTELTNPDDRTATAVDTTILGLASTDAQAEFEFLSGKAYDDTDAKHVMVAVQGVLYHLSSYRAMETDELQRMETRWHNSLTALAKVTSRNRITPSTTSVLTPTDEQANNETVRPDFDRTHFDGYTPDSPGKGPHFSRINRSVDEDT